MEKRIIDCVLIGHNETPTKDLRDSLLAMGEQSGAFRDLNLNVITIGDEAFSFADVFNRFFMHDEAYSTFGPFDIGEVLHPAIAYLCTYLHRRGYVFDFINAFHREKERLADLLKTNTVRTAAVTTTFYVSALPLIEVVSFIRSIDENVKIIVGGPFIATQIRNESEETLAYLFETIGADVYVDSAQGETALTRVIDAVRTVGGFEGISNIRWKTAGGFVSAPKTPEKNRISENRVNWRLFEGSIGFFPAVRTAVSCPFSCAFCGFPEHAGDYITVEPGVVTAELDELVQTAPVRSVTFIDDTFNVPPDRFKQILRNMVRKEYPFAWNAYFRCQFADEETVSLMKECGCEGVFLGIESADPDMLKRMNKKAAPAEYKRGIELLHKYEIPTHASFIIGFPGETEASVEQNIRFIEDMRPTFYRAQMWYCEPITPVWRKRAEYGIEGSHFEWRHHTMDAAAAADAVDRMFLTIQNSVWLPQQGLDFFGLFRVRHRGLDWDRLIPFIEAFNAAVRGKFQRNGRPGAGAEALERLERVYYKDAEAGSVNPPVEKATAAEFDF